MRVSAAQTNRKIPLSYPLHTARPYAAIEFRQILLPNVGTTSKSNIDRRATF